MKNLNYSSQHIKYLKNIRQKKLITAILRVGLLVIILALWELSAQLNLIDPFITSSPSRIVNTIYELFKSGNLFYHIGVTLAETVCGFFIAVTLGYAIALILYSFERLRSILEPYIVVANSLPKIALGPLIIIWMGTGYNAIVFMTVIVSIIVCIMNSLTSFLGVDKTMITLLKSLGASRLTIIKKLIIPASLPQFINTLKVAVGLAWIGSIMGEYIVSKAGLGYLIVYGGQVFKLDLVMSSTIILCILAGGMYGLIVLLEKAIIKN